MEEDKVSWPEDGEGVRPLRRFCPRFLVPCKSSGALVALFFFFPEGFSLNSTNQKQDASFSPGHWACECCNGLFVG